MTRKPKPSGEVRPRPRKPQKPTPPPYPPPSTNGKGASHDGGGSQPAHSGDPPLQSFASIVPSSTEWYWRPYLPRGRVVLLVGETGSGKSVFLSSVIAGITGGVPFGERPASVPGRALLWSPEETASEEVLGRLTAAGARLDRVANGMRTAAGGRAPVPLLPDRLDYLERRINHAGASLIVMDPVTTFLGSGVDPNSGAGARAVMEPLLDLAERTSCTICVVMHYRKGRGGTCLDWVAGNAAWTQVPRFVLAFGRDPSDESSRIIAMPKCSLAGRVPSLRFEIRQRDGWPVWALLGECGVSAQDMGVGVVEAEDRDARRDARLHLRELLDVDERRQVDVMATGRALGISERTLRRAKIDLGVRSEHRGTAGDRHLVWVRPERWPDLA